jgi:hypothetical protein
VPDIGPALAFQVRRMRERAKQAPPLMAETREPIARRLTGLAESWRRPLDAISSSATRRWPPDRRSHWRKPAQSFLFKPPSVTALVVLETAKLCHLRLAGAALAPAVRRQSQMRRRTVILPLGPLRWVIAVRQFWPAARWCGANR